MKRTLLIGAACLSLAVFPSCADEAADTAASSQVPDVALDVSTETLAVDGADATADAEPDMSPENDDGPALEDTGEEVESDAVEDTPTEVVPDAGTEDVVGDSQDALGDTVEDGAGDIVGELPTDNCGELGIEPHWTGSWTGNIDYDVDSSGLLSPEQGTLAVYGTLSFSISCLDSKFIVQGLMAGDAEVPGFDPVPFELTLSGYYNPATGALNADIIDGAVVILDTFVICFVGDFNGLHDSGTFTGTWGGDATGTNTPFLTGVASGLGDWTADSVPMPPQLPPDSEPYECTNPASPPN